MTPANSHDAADFLSECAHSLASCYCMCTLFSIRCTMCHLSGPRMLQSLHIARRTAQVLTCKEIEYEEVVDTHPDFASRVSA